MNIELTFLYTFNAFYELVVTYNVFHYSVATILVLKCPYSENKL